MSDVETAPPDMELAEEAPVPARRLLVFVLGGQAFASDMDAFREIIPTRQTTRMPGAPSTVSGLINLRGTIVTVLDGGVLLASAPSVKGGGLTLLVDLDGKLVGLGVDDVQDVHDVPLPSFVDADEGEFGDARCVTAAVEIEGKRVLVLDIKSVARQVIGQGR
jgi:purine-binding chemotaxis protein CheW